MSETLKILIVPIGDISQSVLKAISKELREVYSSLLDGVEVGSKFELRSEAYNPDRDQYRAEIILQHLSPKFASKDGKILAMTSEDLYSKGLNFIFGQAQKPGKFALISLHRLRPEFWGNERDPTLFLSRAVKESIHELGHCLGLDHCEDVRCVMNFSNRIEHTDRKKARLCKKCEEKLKKLSTQEEG